MDAQTSQPATTADRVVLTLPGDPSLRGVASLVLGGIGSRIDLPYEKVDELQLAVLSVLGASDPETITLEIEVAEAAVLVTVGPLPEGTVAAPGNANGARPARRRRRAVAARDGRGDRRMGRAPPRQAAGRLSTVLRTGGRGTREGWTHPQTQPPTPSLIFVGQAKSGPSRRMESLVAWVKVTQKKRLRVVDVDADENPKLVRKLGVSKVPALVLVKNRRVLGRLEGRVTGREIEDLIRPHI